MGSDPFKAKVVQVLKVEVRACTVEELAALEQLSGLAWPPGPTTITVLHLFDADGYRKEDLKVMDYWIAVPELGGQYDLMARGGEDYEEEED